ncbi:MAG: hypothetical protein KDA60_10860 [Planctomycetales bacterium]|nr:hypothetical protein [Planctomycetales bacterium]
MKTTDHAFIKAYSDNDSQRPSTASGTVHSANSLWRHETTGERILISRLDQASPKVATATENASPNASTGTTQWVSPVTDAAVATRWHSLTDNRHIRIDYVDPLSPLDAAIVDAGQSFVVDTQNETPLAASPQATPAREPSSDAPLSGHSPSVPGRPHMADLFIVKTRPTSAHAETAAASVLPSAPSPVKEQPSREPQTAEQRPTIELEAELILPQWEVDALRWNDVCNRLQRSSQTRLSQIVRSLMEKKPGDCNVVGITSYHRGEGRTTIALALARLAGGVNAKVAIVDGDIENPQLAEHVGVAFDSGWERLPDNEPLGEAALMAIHEQLVLLPIGQSSFSVAESTIRTRAKRMMDQLQQEFDLVIVDTGPMFTAAHRWFCAAFELGFDSSLVVRDVRSSSPDQVDDVCCRLIESGIDQAAIIENFQESL